MRRMLLLLAGAVAVTWLSLVTVAAFADDSRPPVERAFAHFRPPVERAFAQSQPMTDTEFATPSTAFAPPLQPDADGNVGAYSVVNYGFIATALAMIAMAWRTLSPIILAVAGFFGQREQAMALQKETNQVALAKLIAKLSLDYVLQKTGVDKTRLQDEDIRYSILRDANDFARDQWPQDWGAWILSGMTLPEKIPTHISEERAQLAFMEAAAAEHLPPVDRAKKPAPAAA